MNINEKNAFIVLSKTWKIIKENKTYRIHSFSIYLHATILHERFINHPEFQVIPNVKDVFINWMKEDVLGKDLPESKCTHLVRNVEFARPVEIEDGVEGTRMSGEKIIIMKLKVPSCCTRHLSKKNSLSTRL